MKKLILAFLCMMMIFALVSCDELYDPYCTVTSSDSKVEVGEEITLTVEVYCFNDVVSCAVRPEFDETYFELVSGEILLGADIEDYSDGIAVAAFEEATELNAVTVAEFVLKAKAEVDNAKVACKVSVENEDGEKIVKKDSCEIKVK